MLNMARPEDFEYITPDHTVGVGRRTLLTLPKPKASILLDLDVLREGLRVYKKYYGGGMINLIRLDVSGKYWPMFIARPRTLEGVYVAPWFTDAMRRRKKIGNNGD